MLSTAAVQGHAVHLLVFGLPVAGLVATICWQELRGRASSSVESRLRHRASSGVRVAVIGLALAAVVHLTVIREHFRENALYGFFFVALAAAQCGLALLLTLRPERGNVRSVAVMSGCVVALWLLSRTTGLPLGSEPWQAEAFGKYDVVATCAEIVTALGCVSHLWSLGDLGRPARSSAGLIR